MDEIEQRFKDNFAPVENNVKNMKNGLSWLWGQISKLAEIIVRPLQKFIDNLSDGNNKGDDWF